MRQRRKKLLTDDDLALWKAVTDSVTPLGPDKTPTADPEPHPPPADDTKSPPPKPDAKPKRRSATMAKPVPRPEPARVQNQFDPALNRRLTRRSDSPDATLDLHGMRQAEAHRALLRFLAASQAQGHRLVAIITGKGDAEPSGSWDEQGRGVLRRAVPRWLDLPDCRGFVVGHRVSPRMPGGEGVIYVQIRRRR